VDGAHLLDAGSPLIFFKGEHVLDGGLRMAERIDIHKFSRELENAKRRVRDRCVTKWGREPISARNSELILEYDRTRALEGLKPGSRLAIITSLVAFARITCADFDRATKEEFKRIVSESDAKYATWSRAKRRVYLKRFIKWVKQGDDYLSDDIFPEEVRWIKRGLRISQHERLKRSDLWTEEEMRKLIASASHPRDKAFFSIVTETGARAGEYGSLTIGDIYQDDFGHLIHYDGKTGERECRVLYSTPHIAVWLNVHPYKENPDAPLFTQKYKGGKELDYNGICVLIQRGAKKAGLGHKRANPHIFRHSRATILVEQGWPEPLIKKYMGWTPDSNMLGTYSHLVSKSANDYMLKAHGIRVQDSNTEPKLKVQLCVTCGHSNSPACNFCEKCGRPLQLKTALEFSKRRTEASNLANQAFQDPSVAKALDEFMRKRHQAQD